MKRIFYDFFIKQKQNHKTHLQHHLSGGFRGWGFFLLLVRVNGVLL